MFNLFINIFAPVAVEIIKFYVKNSETKHDDKILEITKIGAKYLAKSSNNTVTPKMINELLVQSMVK